MGYADKLRGQNIVVIGGTSGIGYGAAAAFLDVGATVTVISSSQSKVDEAVKQLGSSNASGLAVDVHDEQAVVKALQSRAPIDHLVFSAVDNIIRAVLKYDLIRKGGSLTLTSGTAGIKPGKGAAVGGALNGGILTLTKGLASDLTEKKIRVNTVVPGLVQTPLWDKQGKTKEEQSEIFEKGGARLSVGFVATPEHIAEAYLYAVRADYANGTLIEIDGGHLL